MSLPERPPRTLEAQLELVKHLTCICDSPDCPRVVEVDALIKMIQRQTAARIAADIEQEAEAWAKRPVSADRPNTVGKGLNMARIIALQEVPYGTDG